MSTTTQPRIIQLGSPFAAAIEEGLYFEQIATTKRLRGYSDARAEARKLSLKAWLFTSVSEIVMGREK